MIRITVEIDGVELVTTTQGGDSKPTAVTGQFETASSEYMAGGATGAGAAPQALKEASELDAPIVAESSDAGVAAYGEAMTK